MAEIKIKDLRKQYKALIAEREFVMNTWRELADNFLPLKRVLLRDGYEPTDVYEQMGSANELILDGTPIRATRVLGAGMQSGMTSPAKRWFKLGHSDSELEQLPQVKEWLESVQQIIFDNMARSNFYNNTHRCYLEVAIFGTLVMIILPDDGENQMRTLCLPIGSYVLAANFKNEIDTIYRQIYMTADQMVEQFGLDNVSFPVKNAYEDMASRNRWFSVIHVIKPNKDVDPDKDDVFSMAYSSIYFEEKTAEPTDGVLRRSGFPEKPFVAARWDVTGESVYGDSPAMDVLHFAKQLQAMSMTLLKVKQKNADPPLNVPPGMKTASTAPGALNYMTNPSEKITSTVDVRGETQDTSISIQDIRQQISEGLFNDVFRTLALSPQERKTVVEVLERVSEGLRQLGPVLERLQFEFQEPAIDRIFALLERQGQFPEPPEEITGARLKIEYVSPLAQAQKAVGTEAISSLIFVIQSIAPLEPSVVDNIDFDQLITLYASLIGISPTILNSEDIVREIREIRAQEQARAIAQEQENQDVANLKQMSETQVTDDTNAIESAAEAAGG